VDTVLLAARSAVFSIGKYFVPAGYSPLYPVTSAISPASSEFFVPIIILVVASVLAIWSLSRTRLIAFSLGFYLLFLMPSFANFAKGNEIFLFSDRYVYLAQIGFLFALGYALDRVLVNQPGSRGVTVALWIVFLPLCSTLALRASAQSLVWKDGATLFRHALSRSDGSALAHYNLGLLEHRAGNRAAAFEHYQKALAINPRLAKALGNLGVYYMEAGQTRAALKQFRMAVESDPSLPDPHNNLGTLLMSQGETDAAIEEFRKAIALGTTSKEVHLNLAAALQRKGLHDEAMLEYARAFERTP
jgi:tetratricopeptide (TPR) repeat protein